MSTDDMPDVVGIAELQILLGRARSKDSKRTGDVSRGYAQHISGLKSFPDPVVSRPKLRLWRRSDVEAWLDQYRPSWRDNPPPDEASS